jgi:hypothetical protein
VPGLPNRTEQDVARLVVEQWLAAVGQRLDARITPSSSMM